MKLSYYIDELRELLPHDYENVDDRTLIRWINSQRVLWIKNSLGKGYRIPEGLIQTIPYLQMDLVDQSRVPFISTDSRILKSVVKLSEPIYLNREHLILNVSNSEVLFEPYNLVDKNQAIYSGNGKFNTRSVFAFYYDNNMWIKLQKDNPRLGLISYITVEGIFQDPVDIYKRLIVKDEDYNDRDVEYPLTDTIWIYMKEKLINNGLNTVENEQKEEQSAEY